MAALEHRLEEPLASVLRDEDKDTFPTHLQLTTLSRRSPRPQSAQPAAFGTGQPGQAASGTAQQSQFGQSQFGAAQSTGGFGQTTESTGFGQPSGNVASGNDLIELQTQKLDFAGGDGEEEDIGDVEMQQTQNLAAAAE